MLNKDYAASKKHYLEAVNLLESLLSRSNPAFEKQVAEYEYEGDQEEQLRQKLIKKTFVKFISEDFFAWCRWFLSQHFTDDTPEFHYEIINHLFDESVRKMALASPRGTAKSTLVSVSYALYNILNSLEPNIIVISINEGSAKKLLMNIKSELTKNEQIQFFYGSHKSDEVWNELEFIWNKTICSGFGLGMPIRVSKYAQSRPTLALIDDIESREIFTMIANKELEEWQQYKDYIYREVEPALDPKTGKVRFIGTIFHPQAILPYMQKSKNYFSKTWSIIYEDKNGKECSLWPERFPLESLHKIRDELFSQGQASVWWSEYMNKPVSQGNKTFNCEITYYTEQELEDKRSNLIYFQWFDLATGHGKDKTASIVIGRDQEQYGNVYVMAYFNERIDVDQATDKILDLTKIWNPIKLGSQKDLLASTNEKNIRARALQRGINLNLTLSTEYQKGVATWGNSRKSKLSKEARMNAIVPWMKAGKIRLGRHMKDLIDQLTAYPHTVYDDLIESLRDAVMHSFPSDKEDAKVDEMDEANRKLREFLDNWKDKIKGQGQKPQGEQTQFGRWEQERSERAQEMINA